METILQGVLEVDGVTAAMVLDAGGRVLAHRGRAVYDRATCEAAGGAILKALESIQLQQDDWDSISAQYADGKLLLRRLGGGAGPARHVLAVVADPTLNASFATVAIRVAANKLQAALDGGAGSLAASLAASAPPPGPGASQAAPTLSRAAPAEPRPALASSGLSWSRAAAPGASGVAAVSGVAAADLAAGALLARCAKELARHVGPMSRVYVQEAVARVSPGAPFSLDRKAALVADLAAQIEDPADRAEFQKALEKA